jgi:osmotically-inducible protein OsmY
VVAIQDGTELPAYTTRPHFYSYNPYIEPRITGIGIKSDKRMKKDIESELWWSPFVNEDEVNVTVHEGNVILTGIVDTPLEKRYAEVNAREGGAITVENRLVIE